MARLVALLLSALFAVTAATPLSEQRPHSQLGAARTLAAYRYGRKCVPNYFPCAKWRGRKHRCCSRRFECRRWLGKRSSKRLFVCLPKRRKPVRQPKPCLEDGKECKTDDDCCKSCVEVACGEDDETPCRYECGARETVEYEPPVDPEPIKCVPFQNQCPNGEYDCCDGLECKPLPCGTIDEDGAGKACPSVCVDEGAEPQCAPDETKCTADDQCCGSCLGLTSNDETCPGGEGCFGKCGDSSNIDELQFFARRCPGKKIRRGGVCYRKGWRRGCRKRKDRCKWEKRKRRWVGVCRRRGRPIFNC